MVKCQKGGWLGGGQSTNADAFCLEKCCDQTINYSGIPFQNVFHTDECFLYIATCSQLQGIGTVTTVSRTNKTKQAKNVCAKWEATCAGSAESPFILTFQKGLDAPQQNCGHINEYACTYKYLLNKNEGKNID